MYYLIFFKNKETFVGETLKEKLIKINQKKNFKKKNLEKFYNRINMNMN